MPATRSRGARSQANATSGSTNNKQRGRLNEPSKSESPSKLAGPFPSRYSHLGVATAAAIPGSPSRTTLQHGSSGESRGGRDTMVASAMDNPTTTVERRFSTFEAYVGDDELHDGQTGWASSPSKRNFQARESVGTFVASARSKSGAGESAGGVVSNHHLNSSGGTQMESAGSSIRPGGRSNFFFGADYAGKKQREIDALAETVEASAAGLPEPPKHTLSGVSGATADVGPRKSSANGKEQEAGMASSSRTVALQDVEKSDVGSGANSTSPHAGNEAPPGLAPLGEDDEIDGPLLINDAGSRGSSGQVAFPPDFDAGRKGSDSEDSATGKTRGDGSLGTKSGSTSLLSMLSASPRSLSTAQDSAAGTPSPRTPLSDHPSEVRRDAGGTGATTGVGRRHGSAPVHDPRRGNASSSSAHEPWSSGSGPLPKAHGSRKSSQSSSGSSTDGRRSPVEPSTAPAPAPSSSRFNVPAVITTVDDDDVPSAHPTPLSAIETRVDDDDLPSDHPTPLSTAGGSCRRGSNDEESKSLFERHASQKSTNGWRSKSGVMARGSSKAAKEKLNPASSSFMDRLKYWGGGAAGSGNSGGSANKAVGVTPAVASRRRREAAAAAAVMAAEDDAEFSPAELRGMPVVPIPDSLEEPSPSKIVTGATLAATACQLASNSTSIAPETPSAQKHTSNTGSIVEEDVEVRRIPSPSPGRHRYDAGRPGAVVDEPLPAFMALAPTPSQSSRVHNRNFEDSDAGSVFNAQRNPTILFSSPRSGGPSVHVSAVTDTEPVSMGSSIVAGRQSSFTSTVDHEDELIDKVFKDAESGFLKDDDESEESDMDWDAASDEEKAEEPESQQQSSHGASRAELSESGVNPRPRGLGVGPLPIPTPAAPAPRYMAIVDAASANSALDSSTSEHDTSPSEDDGGMMAEILTDRLMEVANKMEAAAPLPAEELSDGDGGLGITGDGCRRATGVGRRSRMASRTFSKDMGAPSSRRHVHQSSVFSSGFAASEHEEKDGDSDEGSVVAESAAARKLRRERLRKRSRSNARRNLSAALNVPVDSSGTPINVHTAAYHGHVELLEAYVKQGGDVEACDQFQATALMLCSERGHLEMVDALLAAGADTCGVDENGNSALHLACFYGNREVVRLLLTVDCDVTIIDAEGRTPLQLATDPVIRRLIQQEEVVRISGDTFDLLEAVEVNDTSALASFIQMGQEACGYPTNTNAVTMACKRLRLDRQGRGGMTAVHLAAFHGYSDALQILLEAGADPNAVCDDGETPLHTACTGGSTTCATLLLEHGGNPLATDAKGLVPCEKHIAGGRQEMKRLLEAKAFQATPANLMSLRNDLAEVALQIDAEEDLFVRKGVAIKYLRKALKKKEQDTARLRAVVDARDTDIRNLRDRMESVHRLISGVSAF